MTFQRFADQFSRFFVGGLFIFSGLIKLNDPIGTQIKMEEYFEVFTEDFGSFFHAFIPWALEIGFVMIVLEIVLGVAILLKYNMERTAWVLLALMVFFTFLTFYSAYFNKVTDCGCFGDAIKLTPWQSFTKDVILMVFVAHLVKFRRRFVPALRTREGHAVVLAAAALSTYAGVQAIRHLPYIDFRPYRVGNNIPAQMIAPEQPEIEYLFTKDGEKVRSMKYIADSTYHYESSQILNEDRIKPKITDYQVTGANGEDLTPATFKGPWLFIIMVDARKAGTSNIKDIRSLTQALDGKIQCLVLTASSEQEIEMFRHENQLAVPYAFADATVLKTIIRANPGIALWKDGTVLGNWHFRDTPSATDVLERLNGQ